MDIYDKEIIWIQQEGETNVEKKGNNKRNWCKKGMKEGGGKVVGEKKKT